MLRSSGGERIVGLELEKTEWRGKKRKKRNILILRNNCTRYGHYGLGVGENRVEGKKKKEKKKYSYFKKQLYTVWPWKYIYVCVCVCVCVCVYFNHSNLERLKVQ